MGDGPRFQDPHDDDGPVGQRCATAPAGSARASGIHAIRDGDSKSLDDAVKLVLGAYPRGRYITVSRRSMTLPHGYSAIEVVHHIGPEPEGVA